MRNANSQQGEAETILRPAFGLKLKLKLKKKKNVC